MLKFNNKVLHINDKWLNPNGVSPVPPGPEPKPKGILRVRTLNGMLPQLNPNRSGKFYIVQVSDDVYDICPVESSTNYKYSWGGLFDLGAGVDNPSITEIIYGYASEDYHYNKESSLTRMCYRCVNLTKVSELYISTTWPVGARNGMRYMFYNCTSLTEVGGWLPFWNAEDLSYMFYNCTSLKYIPDYINGLYYALYLNKTFYNCVNVESGIYNFYSLHTTSRHWNNYSEPLQYDQTFYNCGINTVTGAYELSQIPDAWK